MKIIACEMSSGRLQTSRDEQIAIAQNWNSAFFGPAIPLMTTLG